MGNDRTLGGRRIPLLALGVVLALLAVACGGGSDDGGGGGDDQGGDDTLQPQPGGKIVYALGGETDNWLPAAGQWNGSSWIVASAIFDPLVYWDENFELTPFLAELMEPNDDWTVWTMKLRPDITFQNGEKFDAAAVIANMDAQKESPLTGAVMGPILGYEALDDLTVEFTLAATWTEFPVIFTSQPGIMAAPAQLADPEEGARHPIGTGPFAFDDMVTGDYLRVVKNDDYWMSEPYLNEIEFRIIEDFGSRKASLQSGDIDMSLVSADPGVMDFLDDPEFTFHSANDGEDQEVFIMVNQLKPPWDDPELRRALVLATDSQLIVDTIADGLYERATGLWAPSSPWYVETDYPDYDPDEARRIIANWEEENDTELSLTITGPPWNIVLAGGQLLQEQWQEVGIDVDIETLELTQFILKVVSGGYEGAVWQYHGAGHPDGEFVFLHSQYISPEGELGLNFARNKNYAIDEALVAARQTDDFDEQFEQYAIVQQEMAKDLPYIFLWHVRDGVISTNQVHDVMEWTYPDGTQGRGLWQTKHRFHQIWVET